MSGNPDRLPELNLLCLDGGGITGLSSLLILREIMIRVQGRKQFDSVPRPFDHFDLMAGVGTGALSVIMLGRLRMSVDESIATYSRIMANVFAESKSIFASHNGTRRAIKLEQELRAIILEKTGTEDERMIEGALNSTGCKVIVYAMPAGNMNAGLPRAFRTYPAYLNAMPDCTIWEALRASTTDPNLFAEISIGDAGVRERFAYGALGCSNPVAFLLEEAKLIFPGRQVASIVNIGSGHSRTIHIPEARGIERVLGLRGQRISMYKVLQESHKMAIDSERVADEMTRRFSSETVSRYYRLNVDQGMQDIESNDWERLDDITAHTRAYLGRAEISTKIAMLIDAVCEGMVASETESLATTVVAFSPIRDGIKQCPQPSPRFVGRRSCIGRVTAYFLNKTSKRRIFVLHGLGGAGKTQLALKSVEEMADIFTDIIFVNASSRESIEATLSSIAVANHIGSTHKDILKWLTSRSERWLLVFDNADDPDVQLDEYFPQSAECDILFTTRHHDVVCLATDTDSDSRVSGMDIDEGQELLLKWARLKRSELLEGDQEASVKLLQDIDCLALAIVQAGAFIWKTKRTITQYFDMYSERRKEILERGAGPLLRLEGYKQSVYTTWELSFHRLSAPAKQLLLLVAFIERCAILEDIFKGAAVGAQSFTSTMLPTATEQAVRQTVLDFLLGLQDATGAWSDVELLNILSELVSWSLLTYERVKQTYTIHPLVQDWAQAMAPDKFMAVEQTTFLLALSIDRGRVRGSKDHAFRRTMVPHVNKVLSYNQTINPEYAWRLLRVYDEVQQFQRMEVLARHVMGHWKVALGAHHPDTLLSMTCLARALRKQVPLHEMIASGLCPGVDFPEASRSDSVNHEQLEDEAPHFKQSPLLQLLPDTEGEVHQKTRVEGDLVKTKSMESLVVAYLGPGLSQLKEAEMLETYALATRKQVLGEEHLDTTISMTNLASTYRAQGRLKEAEALGREALAIRIKTLGENHVETLQCIASLALTCLPQGQLDEAETLATKALGARMQILGKDHPDTLQSMAIVARIYGGQGRLAEAESLWLSVLQARKRVFGDHHPSTQRSMHYHGLVHQMRTQQTEHGASTVEDNTMQSWSGTGDSLR